MCDEGEPGALHASAHVAGLGGAHARSRTEVELAMKTIVKGYVFRTLLALAALSSSGLALEAGRRWH